MEKYKINDKTLVLFSLDAKTRVYEEDKCFVVDENPNSIMESSCSYYGSSLEGRRKGATSLIGVKYKVPVLVEESKNIIFFPTESSKKTSCTWIRSNKIENYYYSNGRLVLCFKNGDKIVLDHSLPVIENQILRSTRLEALIRARKNGE